MRVQSGVLGVVGSLVLTSAVAARADDVWGTRSDLLTETSDVIAVRLYHGHATLVVRRTFHNGGDRADQAIVTIENFPIGGVATALRTRSDSGAWFDGELLDADVAASRYRELTGYGGAYPKDPALLSWRSQRALELQIFPVSNKVDKVVEYTIEAPMAWIDGRDVLQLPSLESSTTVARAIFNLPNVGDRLFVDGIESKAGTSIELRKKVTLSVARAFVPSLGGAMASINFGKDRTLFTTHLEVPQPLGTIPNGVHTVVVIDASRSTRFHHDAERAAARAYLESFRAVANAKAEVIAFDRHVRALTKGFVSIDDAIIALATPLVAANGSAVDAAIERASTDLRALAAATPKRIVVISDLLTRDAVVPEAMSPLASASGAIVHLATVWTGASWMTRDDDSEWAHVARATGGVFWSATTSEGAADANTLFEEWARPKHVDRIVVSGVGLTETGLTFPSTLAEGTSFDVESIVAQAPPALALVGEVWSSPLRALLQPTPEGDTRAAALFIGSNTFDSVALTDSEIFALAMKGHAVSPMTSYLAIEPGVRPSTDGLHAGESLGYGGGGFGSGIGIGGGGGSFAQAPKRIEWLRATLGHALSVCGGTSAHARIETTDDEIVAVDVTKTSDAIARCLDDAAWTLLLPFRFNQSHGRFDIDL